MHVCHVTPLIGMGKNWRERLQWRDPTWDLILLCGCLWFPECNGYPIRLYDLVTPLISVNYPTRSERAQL